MEDLYNWFMAHKAITTLISISLPFLIGLVVPQPKIIRECFFNVSQFIRRVFGAKVEEKVEEVVQAINDGLHADNKK